MLFKKMDLMTTVLRSFDLHKLSETSISFEISKAKFTYYINGDEEQINRVFLNLFKNAIESIQDKKSKNIDFKGKIYIDITDDSNYIYVNVNDNGIGFQHVDTKKMLTPYFTTKKKNYQFLIILNFL